MLRLAGATLFTILIGVWYTSALWLGHHSTAAAPAYATLAPIPANAHAAPGAAVFAKAACGSCHTLAAAKATGTVGPNLDSLQPTYLQVQQQVLNGSGVMRSFKSTLSAQQIRDVAAFVASRAGVAP